MGAQVVFVVGFALVWRATANAQPPWKAFDYKSEKWLARVIFLSWPMLILLPIGAFLLVYGLFENQPATFTRVLPALLPLGFHKAWLGLVQSKVLYDRVYSETERGQLVSCNSDSRNMFMQGVPPRCAARIERCSRESRRRSWSTQTVSARHWSPR